MSVDWYPPALSAISFSLHELCFGNDTVSLSSVRVIGGPLRRGSAQKDLLEEAECAVLDDKGVRSIEIPCQIKPSLARTSRSVFKSPRPQTSGHSEIDISYGFSEFAVRMINEATEF
jgi:hypothetical protein